MANQSPETLDAKAGGKKVEDKLTQNRGELDATAASREIAEQVQQHSSRNATPEQQKQYLDNLIGQNKTLQDKGILPAIELAYLADDKNSDRLRQFDTKGDGFDKDDLKRMKAEGNVWEQRVAGNILDNKQLLEQISYPGGELNKAQARDAITGLKQGANDTRSSNELRGAVDTLFRQNPDDTNRQNLASYLDDITGGSPDRIISRQDLNRYSQNLQEYQNKIQTEGMNGPTPWQFRGENVAAVKQLMQQWDYAGVESRQNHSVFGETMSFEQLNRLRVNQPQQVAENHQA